MKSVGLPAPHCSWPSSKEESNINKETAWEKSGSMGMGSPSVEILLCIKGNEICEAVATLVPGVVIFEHM